MDILDTQEHGTLSRRAFAQAVGVSHSWVNRQVKNGLLPSNAGGIPIPEGFEAFDKLQKRPQAEKQGANVQIALAAAKCREKEAQARLKELELLEREGSLVRIEDVKADGEKIGTMLREKLLMFPARIAAELFNCKTERELQNRLEDEMDRIIYEIHNASEYLDTAEKKR